MKCQLVRQKSEFFTIFLKEVSFSLKGLKCPQGFHFRSFQLLYNERLACRNNLRLKTVIVSISVPKTSFNKLGGCKLHVILLENTVCTCMSISMKVGDFLSLIIHNLLKQ